MKILFPVSECVPYAKTGGLADVAAALPEALVRLGHEVHVVMPLYRQIKSSGVKLISDSPPLAVPLGGRVISGQVFRARKTRKALTRHFISCDEFFDRPEMYQSPEGDYPDNDQRFIFFCQSVLALGQTLGIKWDIVHCHDWHTGLVPVYLKTLYARKPAYARARSIMTIHNLAFQGLFPESSFALTGLPGSFYTPEGLEFWGRWNFLKAGLVYSDWINTVSRTYAEEIQTPDAGCGLDGVLRNRRRELSGILNGVDYSLWDPGEDPYLPAHFHAGQIGPKAESKAKLLAEQGLHPAAGAPLIGIVSRLDNQKGFDILAETIGKIMKLNIQIILLGTGVKKYCDVFLRLKAQYSGKLALTLGFDNALAHKIYAGSDLFLMPSRYEPCGLGQMISMRYGSIPVVRRTGGLADTVDDFDGCQGKGFTFGPYTGEALLEALKRALDIFKDKTAWTCLMKNAMIADFSWERSAREYQELYQKIIAI